MSAGSKIVSFSLDTELYERFEAWIAREGFPTRSAALQRLVREELESGGDESGQGWAMATVTFVYDHHQRELLERLTHLQHQHLDLVVTTTHVHLDHTRCLEVLILRGPAAQVSGLAKALASTRGVERARISLLPVAEHPGPHGHDDGHGQDHGHADQGPPWHAHAHDAPRSEAKPKTRAKAASKPRAKAASKPRAKAASKPRAKAAKPKAKRRKP